MTDEKKPSDGGAAPGPATPPPERPSGPPAPGLLTLLVLWHGLVGLALAGSGISLLIGGQAAFEAAGRVLAAPQLNANATTRTVAGAILALVGAMSLLAAHGLRGKTGWGRALAIYVGIYAAAGGAVALVGENYPLGILLAVCALLDVYVLLRGPLVAAFPPVPGVTMYKPREGLWARVPALAALFTLTAYGVYEMYRYLNPRTPEWLARLFEQVFLGRTLALDRWAIVSIAAGAAVAHAVWAGLNRPKAVNFLIETESELKRVAWPAKRDYLGASAVVIILLVVLSLFVFGVDWILNFLLPQLGLSEFGTGGGQDGR